MNSPYPTARESEGGIQATYNPRFRPILVSSPTLLNGKRFCQLSLSPAIVVSKEDLRLRE